MALISQIEYQALSDWFVSLPDGPHIIHYEWSQVIPPLTQFAYYVDGKLAYKGIQELLTSTVFGKDSDRFEWHEHQFIREGKQLTIDGVVGRDTSHLGGVKIAWYVALEDGEHIVQFSRQAALASVIGGATVGFVGNVIGYAVDWVLGPAARAFPSTRVWYDGTLLHRQVGVLDGAEVCRFNRGTHVFVVEWDRSSEPVLTVDDVRLKPAALGHPEARPASHLDYELVREEVTREDVEIISTENYPLDNRHGTVTLTNVQEVAKSISREVTLTTEFEGSIELGADLALLLHLLKADISARLSAQTGQKIDETLTRRQTITMSAAPQTFVMYSLTWKRTVRQGIWEIRVKGKYIAVPYVAYLDLTAELKSYDAPRLPD